MSVIKLLLLKLQFGSPRSRKSSVLINRSTPCSPTTVLGLLKLAAAYLLRLFTARLVRVGTMKSFAVFNLSHLGRFRKRENWGLLDYMLVLPIDCLVTPYTWK